MRLSRSLLAPPQPSLLRCLLVLRAVRSHQPDALTHTHTHTHHTQRHTASTRPTAASSPAPQNKVIFNCGNNKKEDDPEPDIGYPNLPAGAEGGGATFYAPDAYAERTGMCPGQPGESNPKLDEMFQQGGIRFGGHVAVEEFGHTIFDNAIATVDPQGWLAMQQADASAKAKKIHRHDADWDCHTASTEYAAAGVELLLYNTRIGDNHKSTTLAELISQDPQLFCLVTRWCVSHALRVRPRRVKMARVQSAAM